MKLRTEMMEIGGQMRLVTFVGCGDNRDPATAKEHDAKAAHAYKQAIADWHEKNGTDADADVYPETTVAFIEKRAAEILAGWLGEAS